MKRRFLGPFNQYVLRLSSGDFIHANAPSAVMYAEGIRLRVELRVACLTVFLDATASEVAYRFTDAPGQGMAISHRGQ